MSTSQGRGLRPGGVVRALGRLFLLIGLGFGAGLLIGVLTEEPELIAGHLRGEGEEIVLDAVVQEPAPAREILAEPESEVAAVDRNDVMKPRADEIPTKALPKIAAPAREPAAPSETEAGPAFAIQVGAFSDQKAATRLANTLLEKGYPTELLAASSESQRWRVRVQPVQGESQAKEMASRLKRDERLPTWVLPMEGRSAR